MILEITKLQKEIEKEEDRCNQLIEDFNKIAEDLKLRYRLIVKYHYPKLSKVWLGFIKNIVTDCIYYNEIEEFFYFCDGIDEKIFNDIKPILEKINLPQKFKIELK